MKMRTYLKCTVTRNNGTAFENPLQLSEARLLSQLAQEHKRVEVEAVETTEADFKSIFG